MSLKLHECAGDMTLMCVPHFTLTEFICSSVFDGAETDLAVGPEIPTRASPKANDSGNGSPAVIQR